MNATAILKEIEEHKIRIAEFRPLSPDLIKQIREYWRVGLTYTSNAIEGNTLTETETKVIIEDGLTVGGKSLREVFEVVGHSEAMSFLYACVDKKQVISEETTKNLHRCFYHRIDAEQAGVYRKTAVFISGTDFIPPKTEKLADLMHKGCLNLQKLEDHPTVLAAKWHILIANIHPFVDGNGRTARLLMNLHLLQQAYPIVVVPPLLRAKYIQFCGEASKGKDLSFIHFVQELTLQAQKDYLRMLETTR